MLQPYNRVSKTSTAVVILPRVSTHYLVCVGWEGGVFGLLQERQEHCHLIAMQLNVERQAGRREGGPRTSPSSNHYLGNSLTAGSLTNPHIIHKTLCISSHMTILSTALPPFRICPLMEHLCMQRLPRLLPMHEHIRHV